MRGWAVAAAGVAVAFAVFAAAAGAAVTTYDANGTLLLNGAKPFPIVLGKGPPRGGTTPNGAAARNRVRSRSVQQRHRFARCRRVPGQHQRLEPRSASGRRLDADDRVDHAELLRLDDAADLLERELRRDRQLRPADESSGAVHD